MKKIIALVIISAALISCGPKKTLHRTCIDLKAVTFSIGSACYTDKTGAVAEKLAVDYVRKNYSGDSAELNLMVQYCDMICRHGDSGLSREDAVKAAMKEVQSSLCAPEK